MKSLQLRICLYKVIIVQPWISLSAHSGVRLNGYENFEVPDKTDGRGEDGSVVG